MPYRANTTEILEEYSRIRFRNRQIRDERIAEIREKIPEIAACDESIRDLNLAGALREKDALSPEELKKETDRLIQKKRELLVNAGYPADYLAPIYDCETCKDTGYVNGLPCECLKTRITAEQFEASHLSERILNETFSNFNLSYYSDKADEKHPVSPRENAAAVCSEAKDFIETLPDYLCGSLSVRGNILFTGPTGVGKTFLTNAIAGELLNRGYSVLYSASGTFFEQLGDAMLNRHEIPGSDAFYRAYQDCDVLIIDDLGTELTNSFTLSTLYTIVNERLLRHRATIISTNLRINDIKERYNERIISRMIDGYRILGLYGEDIRIMKRKAGSLT